jgi:hypothetical protein
VRAVGIVGKVSVKRVHWYRVGADGFYGCGNGCRKTFPEISDFGKYEDITVL